jgi:hypothetical protein
MASQSPCPAAAGSRPSASRVGRLRAWIQLYGVKICPYEIYRMRSIADRPMNWRWLSCVIPRSFRRLYDRKSLFCALACCKNISARGASSLLGRITMLPYITPRTSSCSCKKLARPGGFSDFFGIEIHLAPRMCLQTPSPAHHGCA